MLERTAGVVNHSLAGRIAGPAEVGGGELGMTVGSLPRRMERTSTVTSGWRRKPAVVERGVTGVAGSNAERSRVFTGVTSSGGMAGPANIGRVKLGTMADPWLVPTTAAPMLACELEAELRVSVSSANFATDRLVSGASGADGLGLTRTAGPFETGGAAGAGGTLAGIGTWARVMAGSAGSVTGVTAATARGSTGAT